MEWNNRKRIVKNSRIHQLFEAQVERTPDAVAVVFKEQKLTYEELNNQTNKLAHYLKKRGVELGTRVGICIEPSLEMIVGLMAILKSGGAYVPIDVANPANRITYMLEASKVNVLLTQEAVTKNIPFTMMQNLRDVSEKIVVTCSRPRIQRLDMLPFPDRTLVDYSKYDEYIGEGCVKKFISLITTRGCPYKCTYCSKQFGRRYISRSAQDIFEEVLYHYERGYTTFTFLDDNFNLDRKNSENVFELVIRNNLQIRMLFPNGLRGDLLDADYIDLMAEAGVMGISLALETASPRLQRMIKKHLKIDKFRENLVYICGKYPQIICDLFTMFGFPGETEEETLMTLDFIKGIKWLHFPYLHNVKIFPGTVMAQQAIEQGIPQDLINKSVPKAYHQLSETMSFPKTFAREYQARFFKEYFLLPERLEYIIPIQKRVLTREELIAKYNSYLPGSLEGFPEIANLIGGNDSGLENSVHSKGEVRHLSSNNLGAANCKAKDSLVPSPGIGSTKWPSNRRENIFTIEQSKNVGGLSFDPTDNKLRILMLDLSQQFSSEEDSHLQVEAPLGLMYLLTYLNRELGNKIHGKVQKAMVDFDSFEELKNLVTKFRPQVIGIRSLSIYKEFLHKSISLMKQWCPETAIVLGGPYGTSEYKTAISDWNIDIVVLGEGEITFTELIKKFIENDGKLPSANTLRGINGIAYIPQQLKNNITDRKGVGREVLMLDRTTSELADEKADNPEEANNGGDLIYIIHTSGSAGIPKGVGVSHSGFSNLLNWYISEFKISSSDKTLVFTSFGFDLTQKNLFAVLAVGGQLHLAPSGVYNPSQITQQIQESHTTILNCTPSYFYALVGNATEELSHRLESLRLIILGGEPIDLSRIAAWYYKKGLCIEVVNTYGPTECTDIAAFYRIKTRLNYLNKPIPIGRPIINVDLYILDKNLNPVPVGSTGELCISGAGVGTGYVNDPELSAARFVSNPFIKNSSALLYRTGDLCRYLPDGNIEFLGRIDNQVKLRGFRIELGEIETVLAQHPAVREAVVLLREYQPGSKQLIAYVILTQDRDVISSILRDYLRDKLPEYMVPSVFVGMASFPLTPSGKIDRRALPAPTEDRRESERPFVQPRTELQKWLANIWKIVLGVETIGIHDTFFEIGGESIMAAVVSNRIQQHLGEVVHVVTIFDNPTIAKLADFIHKNYPTAVAKQLGIQTVLPLAQPEKQITAAKVLKLRQLLSKRNNKQ